jgi:hypothetical protein
VKLIMEMKAASEWDSTGVRALVFEFDKEDFERMVRMGELIREYELSELRRIRFPQATLAHHAQADRVELTELCVIGEAVGFVAYEKFSNVPIRSDSVSIVDLVEAGAAGRGVVAVMAYDPTDTDEVLELLAAAGVEGVGAEDFGSRIEVFTASGSFKPESERVRDRQLA